MLYGSRAIGMHSLSSDFDFISSSLTTPDVYHITEHGPIWVPPLYITREENCPAKRIILPFLGMREMKYVKWQVNPGSYKVVIGYRSYAIWVDDPLTISVMEAPRCFVNYTLACYDEARRRILDMDENTLALLKTLDREDRYQVLGIPMSPPNKDGDREVVISPYSATFATRDEMVELIRHKLYGTPLNAGTTRELYPSQEDIMDAVTDNYYQDYGEYRAKGPGLVNLYPGPFVTPGDSRMAEKKREIAEIEKMAFRKQFGADFRSTDVTHPSHILSSLYLHKMEREMTAPRKPRPWDVSAISIKGDNFMVSSSDLKIDSNSNVGFPKVDSKDFTPDDFFVDLPKSAEGGKANGEKNVNLRSLNPGFIPFGADVKKEEN